jgi:light-regulated signal transduction histidine kinase (bacteriophytochrome)
MTELERSNQELDDFAYIASHDLKEPLRGIHNYATFLLEDYSDKLGDEGKRYLDSMKQLAQRMEALINTLLRYSRLGRAELDKEPCDMNEAVSDALGSLTTLIQEAHGEVSIVGTLPIIRCDRVLVVEIFYNLVANAMKYNDSEHKTVEIGVTALSGNPVFYVCDNGIGIPEKHFDGIFRIFKRLHGQGKYSEGSGAGLTIVKKIIERHGGKIWLESTPGKGTTFSFTLQAEKNNG